MALAGLFVAEMLTGSAGIGISDVWKALSGGDVSEQTRLIVTEIRLPKTLTAMLAGMAISISGLLMQTLFRNPLAGPYVLGISSGASLGAAVCVLGTSASASLAASRVLVSLGTAGAAWIGAAAVLGIIAWASRKTGDITVILILGMMLGAGIDAFVQILQFLSDEQALKSYIVWTMGSLGNVSGSELWILSAAVAIGLGITAVYCKVLNLMLLGENYAATGGVEVRKARLLIFLVTVYAADFLLTMREAGADLPGGLLSDVFGALEKAVKLWELDFSGFVCMDIGASTGGFTDCMLQNGAAKVFAVDVGHGQLDWKLREDPRVVCMEKTNIRYVQPEDIGGQQLDFASVDVSFISLDKVLPAARPLLREGGRMVCLIKPQFEAGREEVGKKGVVRDRKVHLAVVERIMELCRSLDFSILGLTYSPIRGPEGNIEYLIYIEKGGEQGDIPRAEAVVAEAHEALDR